MELKRIHGVRNKLKEKGKHVQSTLIDLGQTRCDHFIKVYEHYSICFTTIIREGLLGYFAVIRLISKNIASLFIFTVVLMVTRPAWDAIPNLLFGLILGTALVIPISRIISTVFLAYLSLFNYILRNGNRYVKNRIAPFGDEKTTVQIVPEEVDRDRTLEKVKCWRTNADLATVGFIAILLVLDQYSSINDSSLIEWSAAFARAVISILPGFSLLMDLAEYYVQDFGNVDNVLVLLLFVPAIFYLLPMKNSIKIERDKERKKYEKNFRSTLLRDLIAFAVVVIFIFVALATNI